MAPAQQQRSRNGMAYYTKVLQPGETVRVVGRIHWLIYTRAILFLIVAIGLEIGAFVQPQSQQRRIMLIAATVVLVLAGLVMLSEWLRRVSTEIVVTDHRVIYKRGIFARHSVEMNISKVETVDVDQGVVGRMLGFGTVLIRGTGESLEPLRFVESPLAIRNAITVG
jgi:uncharacterized membrane protein YdbT with pleckstrin-like domain